MTNEIPHSRIEKQGRSEPTCGWVKDEPESYWYETGCSNNFIINDGTPSGNGMLFCCFCGNSIKE